MPDLMTRVLASSSSSSSHSDTSLQPSSSRPRPRLSKREATPPPEFLERSKRSRRLSERAIEAAGQGSSSEEEEESEEDESEDEEEYQEAEGARSLAVSSPSSNRQRGREQRSRTTSSEQKSGSQVPVTRFYGSSSSNAGTHQAELPSSFLPLHLPVASPQSSPPKSFAWDPELGHLVSITPQTQSLALETLTFPSDAYLGSISPADVERSNEFIKAQSCVETCSHGLWGKTRPGRMRKHFVDCKCRKEEFEKRGEEDVLARLCELQLEAQRGAVVAILSGLAADPHPLSLQEREARYRPRRCFVSFLVSSLAYRPNHPNQQNCRSGKDPSPQRALFPHLRSSISIPHQVQVRFPSLRRRAHASSTCARSPGFYRTTCT